jgi:O-antigen ligase
MGTLFHPSALGMYLVILWPINLFLVIQTTEKFNKLIYSVLLIFSTLVVLVTYTRIAWAGLFFAILGSLILLKRFRQVIFLGIGTTLGVVFFFEDIVARINQAISLENGRIVFLGQGSLAWRFSQWKTAFDLFSSKPLLGVGWWTFPMYNQWGSTPHNEYLRVLAESGILGFMAFILLFGSLLIWYIRKYRRISNLPKLSMLFGLIIISIINYLIFSITDNPLGQPEVGWYLWAIVALGVTSIRNYKFNIIDL